MATFCCVCQNQISSNITHFCQVCTKEGIAKIKGEWDFLTILIFNFKEVNPSYVTIYHRTANLAVNGPFFNSPQPLFQSEFYCTVLLQSLL